MVSDDYWERLDEERVELGRSYALAFVGRRRGSSYSMPLWNGRYRLTIGSRGLRWRWEARDQQDGCLAGEGRSWTLGAAVWAAERAAGA